MNAEEYKKAVASGAPLHIRVNEKPMIDGMVYLRTAAVQDLMPVLKLAVQSQFGNDVFLIGYEDGTLGIEPVDDDSIDFMVLDFAALLKQKKR